MASLWFRLNATLKKDVGVLANPDNCADLLIDLYYSSLFGGHQGIIKMYLTYE